MKSIIFLIMMLVMPSLALAAQEPTERVKLGVTDIISIASNSALSVEQKKTITQ